MCYELYACHNPKQNKTCILYHNSLKKYQLFLHEESDKSFNNLYNFIKLYFLQINYNKCMLKLYFLNIVTISKRIFHLDTLMAINPEYCLSL